MTAVWDSNFKLVQHLKETSINGTTGEIKDSTANGNKGRTVGMNSSDPVAGKIDGAFNFDGANNAVNISDSNDWNLGNFTISIWVNANNWNGSYWTRAFMGHDDGPNNNKKFIFSKINGTVFEMYDPAQGPEVIMQGTTWNAYPNVWYNLAVTRNGSTFTFYRDGVPDGTDTTNYAVPDAGNPLTIGFAEVGYFNGLLDEVRISNVTRNADWMKASYLTDTNVLLTYGLTETSNTASAAKYESYNVTNDNTGMLLHAAQTFNATTAHTLTQAKFKIFNDGATGYVRASLRAVDGSGLPTGPNLTTSAPIAISSIGVGSGNWTTVTFDLGAGYQVQAGTTYAIQIDADTYGLNLQVGTNGTYARGRYLSANDAQTWWNTHSDIWDIWFEEWGSSGSGVVASFVYDGDGNRVQKTENGETILYVNKYYEKNLTTGNVTTYYFSGGTKVAEKEATTLRYFHQDSLFSTSLMTDSSGNSLGTIKHYPFGSVISGSVPTDIQFTGQRLDDTGLYYYGARYYDSNIGRFISPDIVVPDSKNPQALNRYSYAINNPLKYLDPFGLDYVILGGSSQGLPTNTKIPSAEAGRDFWRSLLLEAGLLGVDERVVFLSDIPQTGLNTVPRMQELIDTLNQGDLTDIKLVGFSEGAATLTMFLFNLGFNPSIISSDVSSQIAAAFLIETPTNATLLPGLVWGFDASVMWLIPPLLSNSGFNFPTVNILNRASPVNSPLFYLTPGWVNRNYDSRSVLHQAALALGGPVATLLDATINRDKYHNDPIDSGFALTVMQSMLAY